MAEADTLNLVPDHLRGLDRFEARKRVVEEITEEGLAVMTVRTDPRLGSAARRRRARGGRRGPRGGCAVPLVEAKPIMQPFGDRSKVVIEPMLTDQWFVDAERSSARRWTAVRNGEIRIMPEAGEKTYFHWLENIEPWCISRQLWWGHQIPVWYGFDLSGEGFRDDEGDGDLTWWRWVACSIDQAAAGRRGATTPRMISTQCATQFDDVLAGLPTPLNHARVVEVATAPMPPPLAESLADYEAHAGSDGWSTRSGAIADVLDTWFSSGLWPIGTLGWPEDTEEMRASFPTDVLITGFDILFFWVARMIMMQLAVVGEVPFHTVYLHQLVRDEKGKKMSKTTGNVIDPLEIIDRIRRRRAALHQCRHGLDRGVLKLSEDRIAGYRNFGTKLWNAARFAEMNGATGSDGTVPQPQATVNRWIVGETAQVREDGGCGAGGIPLQRRGERALRLCLGNGLRLVRGVLQAASAGRGREPADETRATMAWVIDQCLILLHPIMPFITEELWGVLGERDPRCWCMPTGRPIAPPTWSTPRPRKRRCTG